MKINTVWSLSLEFILKPVDRGNTSPKALKHHKFKGKKYVSVHINYFKYQIVNHVNLQFRCN